MFGHLKAEDFVNIMDGKGLAEGRQSHLDSCPRCTETLRSVQGVRAQMTEIHMTDNEHTPEPDWSEFRSDVRNALLSRSVKKANAAHGWFGGMNWRPAMAWGFSMLFVFALTTGIVLWNKEVVPETTQIARVEEGVEATGALSAFSSMNQTDALDELLTLDEREAANLNMLLQEMTQENRKPQ